VIGEVETLKTTIAELQIKIEESKTKHGEAQADVKRIEREMNELSKDKGSKVKQIKADIVKKKAEVAKLEEQVDTLRSDVLTDELEIGASSLSPLLTAHSLPRSSPDSILSHARRADEEGRLVGRRRARRGALAD